MRDVLKAAVVVIGLGGLALAAPVVGHDLGTRDAAVPARATPPAVPDAPQLVGSPGPVSTLALNSSSSGPSNTRFRFETASRWP